MTTIAYDGRFVAGDGRADLHDVIIARNRKKIRKHNGRLYAMAGAPQMYERVIDWLEKREWDKPAPTAPEGTWSALIFSARDGKVVAEFASNEVPFPLEMDRTWAALGSGTQFASAILRDGGSAHHAVEIACDLDPWSGGTIQVVDIAEALGLQSVREAAE